jgi:hypothetical protein
MMGLSLVAVPVLLDTSTQASHLLTQFVQLYEYGHKLMPSLAVATFLLYGYTSVQKRALGKPWLRHIAAGVTTLLIVPFTWIAMVPTNNRLFILDAESKNAAGNVDLGLVQALLVRWARLHIVRSLFPLAGALIGGNSILQELGS